MVLGYFLFNLTNYMDVTKNFITKFLYNSLAFSLSAIMHFSIIQLSAVALNRFFSVYKPQYSKMIVTKLHCLLWVYGCCHS